jgi:hypothetical protein
MANGIMPQITAEPSMPLESINVDQDMMVDNAVSRGPTVDGAALGGGAGEEAGEEAQEETGQVREEVNMGAEGNQVAQVTPHESTIVNHAASGEDALAGLNLVPGDLEEVGELRDDVDMDGEMDAVAFTNDAAADVVGPGNEEVTAVQAPLTVDSDIYRDYYDNFGAFSSYISYKYTLIHRFRP